jgi:PAS domain S-box-containing protein
MKASEWQAMAAKYDALAEMSDEANALLESIAGAVFPANARDVDHLSWEDQLVARSAPVGQAVEKDGASTEDRLRAAELRFKTLVEQIPAVTFMAVLGEGKNEVYVSPHIEAMLGYSQQEWLADPFLWYWRLHPDDRELWNEEFARGCRVGGPFRAECRFMARDGHTVWVHGEARVVKDDRGRPHFLQGVAFDITEAKRAQEVLLGEAVRKARSQEELAIARRVQTSILPRTFEVSGLEIAATMIPAEEVGGDYYEVLPTSDGAWLAIGDVSGHGLDSGLIMLMVQSATMALTRANPGAMPRDVLCMINDVLYDNIRTRLASNEHITFTLFRYTTDGNFVFAGAHEDILVFRAATGGVDCIRPPGTWLGARRDIRRVTVDSLLKLEVGDVVLLYTDGITEAMNAARTQFDIDRLTQLLVTVGRESPATIRDRILREVRAWMVTQHDDMSLLIAKRTA